MGARGLVDDVRLVLRRGCVGHHDLPGIRGVGKVPGACPVHVRAASYNPSRPFVIGASPGEPRTMSESKDAPQYAAAGVNPEEAAAGLQSLAAAVKRTHALRDGMSAGKPLRGLGYYANVLELGGGQGLAVACDGVGTKLMIAEALGKYDTVGIDLVAMNVNDLLCVGAEPIALLDYLAVGRADEEVFAQVGQGLLKAAEECSITIPGGEIAQVREMLRGEGATEGFDLVGTAVGTVPLDRVIWGQDVKAGDVVVGLAADGLHSNGYTLARRILVKERKDLDRHEADLGRTIGEELLHPTALYVRFANALFASDLKPHAVCHVTGDGFMNLLRVEAPIGFELDALPDPLPVFRLIQERGQVSAAEMHTVFNMGVGLTVILPGEKADRVIALAKEHGHDAQIIGRVTDEADVVRLPKLGLVGNKGEGLREA